MHLVLDGRGPLHAQLSRALRQTIDSGRIHDGARLPPSRDLASLAGVSRGTVTSAYQQLQAEGYLVARVGKGSFARAPRGGRNRLLSFRQHHEPQSAFARRARATCDMPSLRAPAGPGPRYAFDYEVPRLSPTLPTEWARLVARVAPYVKPDPPCVQGMACLRDAIAAHARMAPGIACTADDILVVNGSRQALALAVRVLLDPGDLVAIEDPQHPGIRQVLQVEGMELFAVPVDDEGLRVDVLARRQPKVVCVTPSLQFPTGAIMSQARREALVDYALRNRAWIIELDCAGIPNGAAPPGPLHALDPTGRVIPLASFSKTLFPALRLGYVVMPPGLRDDFIAAKWASDLALPALEQAALAGFISSGAYGRHVLRCTKVLAARCQRLREAFAGPRPPCGMRLDGRNAGQHLVGWLDGFDDARMRHLLELARRRGLGLHPLAPFYLRQPPRQGLVLGFSSLVAPDIPAAAAILGDCLDAVAGVGQEAGPRHADYASAG